MSGEERVAAAGAARGGARSAHTALAWGRLLRLSLAPTALADVAAGTVLGALVWPRGAAPFVLMLASACVYHGGMALNDWADRAEDARVRPGRPIPSGAIAPGAALGVALALLVLGPLVAALVTPRSGLALAAVSACAALYDLVGRGPWRGPLLLAACRAGNLGSGLAFASTLTAWRPELWLAPCAYGLYVFLVSRVARLEDVETPPVGGLRPTGWVRAAGVTLIVAGVLSNVLAHQAAEPDPWYASLGQALGFLAAIQLLGARGDLAGGGWSPGRIRQVAGTALRRLLVVSAVFALGAGTSDGTIVAAVILCGYPLAFALRRVFPPT